MDVPDETLGDIAGEDPESILAALAVITNERDLDKTEFLELAMTFASDGVNIFRVMREHPDTSKELLGIEPDFSDSLVSKYDRLADE